MIICDIKVLIFIFLEVMTNANFFLFVKCEGQNDKYQQKVYI